MWHVELSVVVTANGLTGNSLWSFVSASAEDIEKRRMTKAVGLVFMLANSLGKGGGNNKLLSGMRVDLRNGCLEMVVSSQDYPES
ncbi:hypothetical protein [Pseudomonas aeruginosa]|uniref:hypothetical protein n=1 Tax=Pseudomonas aeruginosa TaxID=287 RepID=UPI002E2D8273|nr:hypothetical protein [Pseudomonas aeruginosa]